MTSTSTEHALRDTVSSATYRLSESQESDPAASTSRAKPRDATFDILKGLSIVEVMIHHTLSTGMRKFTETYDPIWWTMATLSRILHFAVPTFLLVSAVLLARSVASKPTPDWKRFYARRVQRTLWPYLLWSGLYAAFRLQFLRAENDLLPVTAQLPLIGHVEVPSLLTVERLMHNILWGKSYFHIYFMVVLLQFSLLFPVLFYVMRRVNASFVSILMAAGTIQLTMFLLQGRVFRLPYPGSTVIWYCMPVLAGMWLGLNWKKWEHVWHSGKWWFGAMAIGGLAVYLPLALRHYLHLPISSLAYNCGIAVYCLGIALLLLGLSRRLTKTKWPARFFQTVGDRSIAFFLIHPMVLYLLGGPKVTAVFQTLPAPTLMMGLIMFFITWLLSSAVRKLKMDGFLFGR